MNKFGQVQITNCFQDFPTFKESYDEEVDDDETMSERTLKDFTRKKSSNGSTAGSRAGSSTSRKGKKLYFLVF